MFLAFCLDIRCSTEFKSEQSSFMPAAAKFLRAAVIKLFSAQIMKQNVAVVSQIQSRRVSGLLSNHFLSR